MTDTKTQTETEILEPLKAELQRLQAVRGRVRGHMDALEMAQRRLSDLEMCVRANMACEAYATEAIEALGELAQVIGDDLQVHAHEQATWHVEIKRAPHEGWTHPSGWGPYDTSEEAKRARVQADKLWLAARIRQTTRMVIR